MPIVKCSVGGCSTRLQPLMKVDPRDRDTWFYPECHECGRAACEEHSSEVDGRVLCERCLRAMEERESPAQLLGLGIRVPSR